jgi:hypothetical protein
LLNESTSDSKNLLTTSLFLDFNFSIQVVKKS